MKLRSLLVASLPFSVLAFGNEPAAVGEPTKPGVRVVYTPPQPPDSASLAQIEARQPGLAAGIQRLVADPDYRAAHRNAWERFILTISEEEVASSPGFENYTGSGHSHHSVPGPSNAVFGMESGQDQARIQLGKLRGAPLAERERLVAELRLLQRDLAAKKRAPLPYCHSHDYATRADRLEAMRAAGIPEK